MREWLCRKKTRSYLTFLFCIVLTYYCTWPNASAYDKTTLNDKDCFPRTVYSDCYDSEELIKMVLNGEITENEYTKIDIKRSTLCDEDVLTIALDELIGVKKIQGETIKEFKNTTITTIGRSLANNSNYYNTPTTSLTLTIGVYYNTFSSNGNKFFKITRYTASATSNYGRHELRRIDVNCGQNSDAWTSSTNHIGARFEHSSFSETFPNLQTGSICDVTTGFIFYMNNGAYPCSIGANAELDFVLYNQTTLRTLDVEVILASF